MQASPASIQGAAELIVSRFGQDAAFEVSRRMNGHLTYGELDSYRRWALVLDAVERINGPRLRRLRDQLGAGRH